MPYGAISGMDFAARTPSVARPSVPPLARTPLERPLPCAPLRSLLPSIDASQDRLASFEQPDERTPAWGVNLFAGLPVHVEVEDRAAGRGMGLRAPALSGVDSLLGSGLWLSVAV